ncbi:hypothetical protein EKD00_01930 [Chlorobium phaeovibrioides]|uniref:Uncharacterized protein n=1 Tax=Chlorobium phaeovibrioides TaxID=1094 RepID=A0A3S0U2C3_CHLPH|nr:hypothetical protein FP507_08845 [Chlorobium phaeovibrioides]RTY36527.1 hypothetical protein EKD00_01930 [Chlorobium phaeovibrioides]RTY39554.1 hypothetical protein EKD02_02455 [Chlorobium phaeovibrioides]
MAWDPDASASKDDEGFIGYCRVNPPVMTDDSLIAIWPKTYHDCWCLGYVAINEGLLTSRDS